MDERSAPHHVWYDFQIVLESLFDVISLNEELFVAEFKYPKISKYSDRHLIASCKRIWMGANSIYIDGSASEESKETFIIFN